MHREQPSLTSEKRVVAITGAARGIGRAIATGFAQAGASVALCDIDAAGLCSAATELTAQGGRALAFPLDVTDHAACRATLATIASRLGPVDTLINNAGILPSSRLGDAGFIDDWHRSFRVNLDGCMHMADAALPQLRQTRGCIVNVCSTSAVLVADSGSMYAASKAALLQFTRSLAVELGRDGIRANAVGPGIVRTAIGGTPISAELQARYLARTPLGRIAEPEDIVGPVMFLASPLAAHVTGTFLPIDGGYLVTSMLRPAT